MCNLSDTGLKPIVFRKNLWCPKNPAAVEVPKPNDEDFSSDFFTTEYIGMYWTSM